MESLGTALLLTRGYSAPEVDRAFTRARELCHELGIDVPVRALYGSYVFHVIRSEREASTALLSQFHRLAERSGEPVALIAAHANTGLHAFLSGDFVAARDEMTAATKWYDTEGYRAFFRESGYDGGLYPFAMLMWVLWILGYPERSLAVRDQVFALAEQNASPHSRLVGFTFAAALAHDRREPEVARDLAERILRLAVEQHLHHWVGPATCIHGWAAVQDGEIDQGTAEIQRGLAILDAVGFRTWRGYYLSYLAEADLARGVAAGGLAAVHEALAMTETLLDCFYEAELNRLEGELQHRQGELSAAEASFRRALDVASRQHARAFELRAAVSCGRLLRDRGDPEGARALVAPIYRSFSEGFQTPDLQEARALLADLEAPERPAVGFR
jgi:ATP/maltotriose-dependent transcriptional regulator MalT